MATDLKLYGMDFTPLVRSCKLVLQLLDLKYEYVQVDLFAEEQHTPEHIKRNPLKLVPVLEDNGELLSDSSAICCYLVDKYAKDDQLYPKDLIERAKVNRCLFFNSSVIYPCVRDMAFPIFKHFTTVLKKEVLDNIKHCLTMLETLLEGHDFMSGNNYTIADLLCGSTVLILTGIVTIDKENFPLTNSWLQRLSKQVPHFDETHIKWNNAYIEKLKSMITEIEA